MCSVLYEVGRDKSKFGFDVPVQQSGSYWDRSSALSLVGVEPTQM